MLGLVYGFSGNSNKTDSELYESPSRVEYENNDTNKASLLDTGYSEHDEDVNRYQNLGGTYTVEACNASTGSCYDLDADIDSGSVERIYFPNGGHLDLDGAELDEDGNAIGDSYTQTEGYNGDEWEINCSDCE